VIARADQVLEKLEAARNETGGLAAGLGELPLFAAAASEPAQSETAEQALAKRLKEADLDALSPRDALDLLYDLKKSLD
jgi:DNA mismatch repair protein MutS